MRPQSIFVSATPGKWEIARTGGVYTEQVIRPTGLIDPVIEVRPVRMQVDDLLDEVRLVAKKEQRVLVTTLTKRMAEDLTEYFYEQGIRVRYMHSDIDTIERIEILRDLRLGVFDVLVGINLLREGLDIPEVALVAILDADKEGFLRSETSLLQTIGRAARNAEGRVIMYADKVTGSMERAIAETNRRRDKQIAHNEKHGITPQNTTAHINSNMQQSEDKAGGRKAKVSVADYLVPTDALSAQETLSTDAMERRIGKMKKDMLKAASDLEFEKAAQLRDQISKLEKLLMDLPS